MSEFDFIRDRLAPLAAGAPGARGLRDDAATLDVPPGHELVATADALVAGVHFRTDEALDVAAAKALRVNLSDLAAKGASPLGYLLSVAWPRSFADADRDRFVAGLARDQEAFGLPLLGGDTVVTPGPLTVAVTALGAVEAGRFVARSGARAGDGVYVTGTIGDAGLGLAVLEGEEAGLPEDLAAHVVDRHRRPEPRLAAGRALVGRASAAIDISDGLLADAGHVAEASGLRLEIAAAAVPLSPAARAWRDRQGRDGQGREGQAGGDAATAALCAFGDDYELLFCASAEAAAEIAAAAGVPVTRIGAATAGEGVALLGEKGQVISINKAGFTHF